MKKKQNIICPEIAQYNLNVQIETGNQSNKKIAGKHNNFLILNQTN